ncbi:MAG TPA: hypothetical protein ENJ56_05440, partial [Anaerolineae bacterium]|nr:hypothetical protein [Anaerolineae bacterium]
MLAGWYLGEKVKELSAESSPILTQARLLRVAAATVLLLVGFLTLKPILVDIDFGAQTLSNLRNVGLLFGRLATLLLLIYLWQKWVGNISAATRQRTFIFATFILLSILTIRFSYMANYVNYDQPNEFLVYAHGNPATKQQVMPQLDELAMRLEGDKTIRVSFDNKSSWPYYWYLRDYPNQHFFGETPDASIKDSPVILAGSDKWDAVENILRDEYEATTLGYIWWPMEEYRKFSWSALFGINADPAAERGLGSRPVREAFWDIFFQRDFTKYGELFGGTYDNGKWPLRADLKMYIRRDVLAKLWDSGVVAAAYQPPVDLYAEGEIEISAELSIGSQGSGDGQLNRPRNVAVSADGHIYVADTGNHRIQVFAPDGTFAFGFGEPTPADTTPLPGQFNEPWGITIDDEFVYVADTWNGRIQKFTLSGEFVDAFGTFAIPADGSEGALEFYGPRSVALFDGKLFITDTGNHRLQVLDTDGNYVGQVGSPGFALGEFNEPVSLALDSNGTIYVAEAWARRIQALSNDLTPLSEWEIDAWDGNSLDNKPYLTTDSNNRIYATDPEGSRVLMFNTIGEYLGKFGRFGTDLSQFDLPTGITTDSNNNLYIADTNNNRILKFAPIDLTQ